MKPEPNFGARSFGTVAAMQTAVATRDGCCVPHGRIFEDAAWKQVGERLSKEAEGEEMSIEFTQYLMPHGTPKSDSIDRPEDVEAMARAVVAAGYFFEMELLSDYRTVSLTVADRNAGADLEIELVQNGPDIPYAVDRLVERAFANLGTHPVPS